MKIKVMQEHTGHSNKPISKVSFIFTPCLPNTSYCFLADTIEIPRIESNLADPRSHPMRAYSRTIPFSARMRQEAVKINQFVKAVHEEHGQVDEPTSKIAFIFTPHLPVTPHYILEHTTKVSEVTAHRNIESTLSYAR